MRPVAQNGRTLLSSDTAPRLAPRACALGRNCGLCKLALSGALARSRGVNVDQELVSPRLPPRHARRLLLHVDRKPLDVISDGRIMRPPRHVFQLARSKQQGRRLPKAFPTEPRKPLGLARNRCLSAFCSAYAELK